MSLSANTVWEVRTAGADTAGGGFVAGASGTDYSQQDAAQYALTAIATAGIGATFLTASAAANMVGNILQVISGTNFTTGFFEILSVSVGVSVTVDRNICTGVGASGVINIGGALATFAKLASAMVGSNKAFIKSGAYTSTASNTFAPGNVEPYYNVAPTQITGYKTVRGDIGQTAAGTFTNNSSRPTITLQTNSNLSAITSSNTGFLVENLIIDCASLGGSKGISFNGVSFTVVKNCKVSNFDSGGININGVSCSVTCCEVTGGTSSAFYGINIASRAKALRNYVHDNACPGIVGAGACSIVCNLIVNNNSGIYLASFSQPVITNNTIYGSTLDGVNGSESFSQYGNSIELKNNIFASNGRYGVFFTEADGYPAMPMWDGNAYWSNTSGNRHFMDNTSGINGVSPYTNVLDVVVTDGSPFTNAAGGDFTLNNTALRGALLRGTATPGAIPGQSQVGYLDFGCFQHQDSGGGGGLTNPIISAGGGSIIKAV